MKLRYRLAARLGLLHRLCYEPPAELAHDAHWLGRYGEYVAASWLRAQGYRILRQNFQRRAGGEIDIVSREGDVLVFGEVKTRLSRDGGAPARAVDRRKRELLRTAGRLWMLYMNTGFRDVPYRFDIIEVILVRGARPELRLLPDIFGMEEGTARPWGEL